MKAQLNNEIMLKDRFMEQANDLERNLREAKRQIEELGGELRISQEKAAEIEQKWQEIKEELKVENWKFENLSKNLENGGSERKGSK